MTWFIRMFAAATLWLAVGGPALAQPAASPSRSCFYERDISSFSVPNDSTVYLRVGVRDIYRLELMSPCTGLTFRQSLGIKTTPGSRWICSPLDAEVVYRDNGISQRCPVTGLHALTPAEVAKLPKKDMP